MALSKFRRDMPLGFNIKPSDMVLRKIDVKCDVLLIDSDPIMLATVSKMLRLYGYTVSTTRTAADALSLARKKSKSGYQVILTDVHLPDMGKYEFIEKMKLFSKSPFVIMSAEGSDQAKYNGLIKGAQLYLDKPVSMNELKSLWQIAYRRYDNDDPVECIDFEEVRSFHGRSPLKAIAPVEDVESRVSMDEATNRLTEKRERWRGAGSDGDDQENENDGASSSKRPKLIWTDELHYMFLQAINFLGIEGAQPKTIQQFMNVPGLTREKVASHLQKYRLNLKREQEAIQMKTMIMARHIAESGSGMLAGISGNNIPLFNGKNMDFPNAGNFDFGSNSTGSPYLPSNFIRQSEQEQLLQIRLPPLAEGSGDHGINSGAERDGIEYGLFKTENGSTRLVFRNEDSDDFLS